MERFSKQPTEARTASASSHAAAAAKHYAGQPTIASKILVISLIVASIALTGTIFASAFKSLTAKDIVKSDKYQAIFLDNGQVYFGKVSNAKGEYVKLTDIYYLQVQQQIQPGDDKNQQAQQSVSLAKLGNELHGPEDEMFIQRSKITFWENLKDDGQVVEAITRYKNGEQPENNTNNQNSNSETNGNTNQNNSTSTQPAGSGNNNSDEDNSAN